MSVTRQQVAELYVATFNRAPDARGLSYWTESSFTDETRTIESIAQSFFDQVETQVLYPPGTPDEDFVTTIYQNLFNRGPDTLGLAYWTGENGLGGTMTRSVMIEAVKNGAQGTDRQIIDNKAEIGLYHANRGLNTTGFSVEDITQDQTTVVSAKNEIDDQSHPHDWVTLPADLSLNYIDAVEMEDAPHTAIGQVSIPAGASIYLGTGFLISPEHILTNAHVVYDEENGDLLASGNAVFSPGLNGEDSSTPQYHVTEYWISNAYITNPDAFNWPDDDLAILKLDQPVGITLGYLSLEPDPIWNLEGIEVQSAGYPSADIEQDDPATAGADYYQWEVDGTLDQYAYFNGVIELSDTMKMTGGASGSPIFYTQEETTYFKGVYSGALVNLATSDETEVAAAIDRDSYNWILGVLQQDGYYTDYSLV